MNNTASNPELILPSEAAKRMSMSLGDFQKAMKRGVFPFGTAWETGNGRWVYKIPRGQFEKYMSGDLLSDDTVRRVAERLAIEGMTPQEAIKSRFVGNRVGRYPG